MNSGAAMDAGPTSFFGDQNGFTMPAVMGDPQAAGFPMASAATNGGWGEMQGQAPGGMPPVGEGMLRAMMTMEPMDAMDLSQWDTTN